MGRSIRQAVDEMFDGVVAEAQKRGRNPEWPYVPIIRHLRDRRANHDGRQEQLRRKAFATSAEALAYADRVIDARREHFRAQLEDPREEALRAHWGIDA